MALHLHIEKGCVGAFPGSGGTVEGMVWVRSRMAPNSDPGSELEQAQDSRELQPFVADADFTLYVGDVREVLAQIPEYVFLLTKSPRYFYDADSIREPAAWERWGDQTVGAGSNPNGWIKPKTKQELVGESRPGGREDTYSGFNARYASDDPASRKTRNARSVWTIPTRAYADAHFAVFPEDLPERCIKAGCPEGGTVLDPFMGSGTTALVARRLGRKSVGIELNPEYAALAAKRLQQLSLLAEDVA